MFRCNKRVALKGHKVGTQNDEGQNRLMRSHQNNFLVTS